MRSLPWLRTSAPLLARSGSSLRRVPVNRGEEDQMAAPRDGAQRKADTLAKLTERGADVWVATAAGDRGRGEPHLVPLSLAWIDERVVIALEGSSRTARNLATGGTARLALGPTRDVVIIDAVVDRFASLIDDVGDLASRYVEQADWDPRTGGDQYVLISFRPVRVQAWREANEIAGRTLMRDGDWLV
jgi:hypothetical protein